MRKLIRLVMPLLLLAVLVALWVVPPIGPRGRAIWHLPLTGRNYSGSDFEDLRLNGRNLSYSTFRNAVMVGLRLNHGKAASCDFTGANLKYIWLQHTDLRRSRFVRANLFGARLCDADLRGADLRGAQLTLANLCGANLSGANLESATLDSCDFNAHTRWPVGVTPVKEGAIEVTADGCPDDFSDDEGPTR